MTKELQTILKEFSRLNKTGEKAVLATVVDVRGSSYRLPGARMLISETGATYGTISGGCLEADVLTRAARVLTNNQPEVFTYDTTKIEDSIFSLNMGCRGVIRILLEPAKDNFLLEHLEDCLKNRRRCAIATLIDTNKERENEIGRHLIAVINGTGRHNLITFNRNLYADLELAIKTGDALWRTYQSALGKQEFFIEVINPPLTLVIFGANADAAPLAQFAKNLGWFVKLIDHRAALATKQRFPDADEIIVARAETLAQNSFDSKQTAVVVMTHNYERDTEILRRVLKFDCAYVGALGPKRRTEQILQELTRDGETFDEKQLSKLFAPIGLDIGATTPEAIALAVVAEIQTVLNNRAGGFLRNRIGSIYGRSVE